MKDYLLILLLIITVFISCESTNERIVEFSVYYDTDQNVLKEKGVLKNGVEHGNWEYYTPSGELEKEGGFTNGKLKGEWKYHFKTFDTLVEWIEHTQPNPFAINFSLPVSFVHLKEISKNQKYYYRDTFNDEVFSLILLQDDKKSELIDFSRSNMEYQKQSGFTIDTVVVQKMTPEKDYEDYLIDKAILLNSEEQIGKIFSNIYIRKGKYLLMFSYISDLKESDKGFFFLGEIFFHAYADGTRLASPFVEVKPELIPNTPSAD